VPAAGALLANGVRPGRRDTIPVGIEAFDVLHFGDALAIGRVTESPVGGRATDHMVRFLAQEFGVTPKDIDVVFGRYNVNKQLRIKSPKSLPSVISKELSLQKKDA
jgi:uncharacterized protein YggU (UPF0235/DUF167 family)